MRICLCVCVCVTCDLYLNYMTNNPDTMITEAGGLGWKLGHCLEKWLDLGWLTSCGEPW